MKRACVREERGRILKELTWLIHIALHQDVVRLVISREDMTGVHLLSRVTKEGILKNKEGRKWMLDELDPLLSFCKLARAEYLELGGTAWIWCV